MKALLVLTLCAFSTAHAQRTPDIKISDFNHDSGVHTIHRIDGVEVVTKVEGNQTCLFSTPGPCKKFYNKDSIVLKVSGMAESNLGLNTKLNLKSTSLYSEYSSGQSITRLSLYGVKTNEAETIVFGNSGYTQWGGQVPFSFKIEIHSDLNRKKTVQEYRIPVMHKGEYRFRVTYTDAKWEVEHLETLPSKLTVTGTMAEALFKISKDEQMPDMSQVTVSCLSPDKAKASACFSTGFDVSTPFDPELAQEFMKLVRSKMDLRGELIRLRLTCTLPNEWNNSPELSCTISNLMM